MRGSAQIFQKFEGPLKFFKFCTESENSRVRSIFSNFRRSPKIRWYAQFFQKFEGPLKFSNFRRSPKNRGFALIERFKTLQNV